MAPLRVAVICGHEIARYRQLALETMVRRCEAEISLLVHKEPALDDGIAGTLRDAASRTRRYPLWSLRGLVRSFSPPMKLERPVPIEDVTGTADAERLYCTPQAAPDGAGWILPDDVVDRIAHRADVVVRYGIGVLRGRILDAPEHGVLSFHFGDIRHHRGVMGMGFWEFLDGEDEVGVTLQQLTDTIDGGRIVSIEPVPIADAPTWQAVRRRMLSAAEPMLAAGVRRLQATGFTPREPETLGAFHTIPRGWPVLRYALKNTAGRLHDRRREWGMPMVDR